MKIQTFRDFSYAELKYRNPQTTTDMATRFCFFPWHCNVLCCSA